MTHKLAVCNDTVTNDVEEMDLYWEVVEGWTFGLLMFKEQREDELMLRQNSTEHAFESDNNDSKSDAAIELHFDSDEVSEHVSISYVFVSK